jgi:hypothetical protein
MVIFRVCSSRTATQSKIYYDCALNNIGMFGQTITGTSCTTEPSHIANTQLEVIRDLLREQNDASNPLPVVRRVITVHGRHLISSTKKKFDHEK